MTDKTAFVRAEEATPSHAYNSLLFGMVLNSVENPPNPDEVENRTYGDMLKDMLSTEAALVRGALQVEDSRDDIIPKYKAAVTAKHGESDLSAGYLLRFKAAYYMVLQYNG